MPLEFNLPCTQEISCSMCTQFLSLCSEENTLVCVQNKLMLITPFGIKLEDSFYY
jgi:hypothetical protein